MIISIFLLQNSNSVIKGIAIITGLTEAKQKNLPNFNILSVFEKPNRWRLNKCLLVWLYVRDDYRSKFRKLRCKTIYYQSHSNSQYLMDGSVPNPWAVIAIKLCPIPLRWFFSRILDEKTTHAFSKVNQPHLQLSCIF